MIYLKKVEDIWRRLRIYLEKVEYTWRRLSIVYLEKV